MQPADSIRKAIPDGVSNTIPAWSSGLSGDQTSRCSRQKWQRLSHYTAGTQREGKVKSSLLLLLSLLPAVLGACGPKPAMEAPSRDEEVRPRLGFAGGTWDTAPEVVSWVGAYHPSAPWAMRVGVGATINVQGGADSIRVLYPDLPGMTDVVVDAVRQWSFRPALKDGSAVEARVTFGIMLRPGQRRKIEAPN
ncbi:MAG: hypothetical protein DHS20C21_02860 [Gemmatimonadota bacterium]|nr:MAG: hypothetical protein DHS20C21_02860 [Gemmatimonadota bacterium]